MIGLGSPHTHIPFPDFALGFRRSSRTRIGMFIWSGSFFSRTSEGLFFTCDEWISLGIGLLDLGALVLYGAAFILSWDRVVVKLPSGEGNSVGCGRC